MSRAWIISDVIAKKPLLNGSHKMPGNACASLKTLIWTSSVLDLTEVVLVDLVKLITPVVDHVTWNILIFREWCWLRALVYIRVSCLGELLFLRRKTGCHWIKVTQLFWLGRLAVIFLCTATLIVGFLASPLDRQLDCHLDCHLDRHLFIPLF